MKLEPLPRRFFEISGADTANWESRWRAKRLRPCLAVAVNAIFERAELFDPDGPACVHAAGGDADFGAETEFAAVGELGRGVVQDDGRVDFSEEGPGRRLVLGDDAIGMMRAKSLDMIDRGLEAVDDPDGDDGVEIFCPPVLYGRCRDAAIGVPG